MEDSQKKSENVEAQRSSVITYAVVAITIAVLLIISTGGLHGWLALLLSLWITWRRWERLNWREEQLRQGIDPDAEWRPWKLKKDDESKQIK